MKVSQRWRLHAAAGCSGIQPATMSEVEAKPGIEFGSVPWKSASVDGYTPLQAAAAFSQRRCLKLKQNQGSSSGRCHESQPALTATRRCRLQRRSASDDVWSWTKTRDRVGVGATEVSHRWRLHAAAGCSGVQPATMSEVEPKLQDCNMTSSNGHVTGSVVEVGNDQKDVFFVEQVYLRYYLCTCLCIFIFIHWSICPVLSLRLRVPS